MFQINSYEGHMSVRNLPKNSSCDECGKLLNEQFLMMYRKRKLCGVCYYKMAEDRIKRVPKT